MKLTKSNFLTYLDAPMHLWADIHDKLEKPLSSYDQHLLQEGYKVEKLARQFLETLAAGKPHTELHWQRPYVNQNYEAKADALIHHLDSDTYDIYEIKSSTSVDKTNLYDATFQFLVLNTQIKINKIYIVHLNKEYVRYGRLNIDNLFLAEDVTDAVHEATIEVDFERENALAVLQTSSHHTIKSCYKPKICRCLSLCHPNLPTFSIFNIPNLSAKKKQILLDLGIREAKDVPSNVALTYKQKLVVEVAKTNQPIINQAALRHELESLTFPLYFLDYETYNSAIPLFDGYAPQQQMVFQYSLHTLEHPDNELQHSAHLSLTTTDPAVSLLEQLKQEIGDTGTIIVWNKTFEAGRNKEMASIHPDYSDFLTSLNDRIYDLADSIKEGFLVHPAFRGSWSIKSILPVLAPHLSYKQLTIGKGDEAMTAWWALVEKKVKSGREDLSAQNQTIADALLEYCKLDTLAMVEIWKKLHELI